MIQTQIRPYRELIPLEDGTFKLRLNLHAGQHRARDSKARFVAVLAGTQSGKTCFEPDWLYEEILRCGEGDYIAGTATFPLLGLKMLPEFITVFCDIHHWGVYRDSDKVIEANASKSRIIFFSATHPESIESATAKAAVLDEAGQTQFRQQTWEAVQRRLSLHQGRCLIGTTLYSLGWLKTEIYDQWRAGNTDYEVIQFDSIENPAFPKAEYERVQAIMPQWKFDMFYRGRFTRPAGMVYDCFNEADDVIDRFEIPKNWLIYAGHDFGCVDTETEILTSRGWRKHHEVTDNESVLTLNPQTGFAEWQTIIAMNRYQGKFPMRLIEQRGHNSLTTENHRWLVQKSKSGKLVFETSETLKVNDNVNCAAICSTLPTQPIYRDSFVELVAWFWTEGQIDAGGVSIWQNEGNKAAQIRRCLMAEYGEPLTNTRNGRERAPAGWLERPHRKSYSPKSGLSTGHELCHFAINLNGAKRLIKVAPARVVKSDFLTSLTALQLKLFIETSIKGDGWQRRGRGGKQAGQSLNQSKRFRLEPFQIACTLAGIRTYLHEGGESSYVSLYKRSNFQIGKALQKRIVYEGLIWCPTTPNGTWFARRKGTTYFTGNSANPAAMFYAQDTATGLFYAFAEYLPGSRSTYEHVEAFKKLTAGYTVLKRMGGNLTTEEGWRNDYTSHGWHIQPPKENMKRVENQIARVYALNKLHKVKVFRDLRHYLDEKLSFSYVLDGKYEPTEKYDNESAMHLLAAERYILSDFTPETVGRGEARQTIFDRPVAVGTSRQSIFGR